MAQPRRGPAKGRGRRALRSCPQMGYLTGRRHFKERPEGSSLPVSIKVMVEHALIGNTQSTNHCHPAGVKGCAQTRGQAIITADNNSNKL